MLLRAPTRRILLQRRRLTKPSRSWGAAEFSTQVGSITFWCSDESVVDRAHRFFDEALGCKSEMPPHRESHTSGIMPRYRSSVRAKDIRVEFVAYPWIAKIREAFSLPSCSRLVSLEVWSSSGIAGVAQDAPAFDTPRSLLPLCVLRSPYISPTVRIVGGRGCGSKGLGGSEEARESGKVSSIKEIVLGLHDEQVSSASSALRDIAQRKLGHGLMSFGEESAEATAVRVIPSTCSTVVFRVDDCEKAREAIGQGSNCAFAAIGRNGISQGDYSIILSELAGLDLRISDCETHQAHFYETPESHQGDQAEFGERDDMGQMSCVSVVGMEAKHRMRALPSSLVQRVSRPAA